MDESEVPSIALPTLKKCRPLRDPVRAVGIVLQVTAILVALLFVSVLVGAAFRVTEAAAKASGSASGESIWVVLLIGLLALLMVFSPYFALISLLRLGKRRALIVRKFRN